MTYEIITQDDLQKFRLQLLEDLTRIMPACILRLNQDSGRKLSTFYAACLRIST